MTRLPSLVHWIAIGLLLAAGANAPIQAAMILSIEHVPDGSVEPPGDRVDVSIALFPGEASIDLELRGFVRIANSSKPIEPLPGRDPRTGNPAKQWRQKKAARMTNDQRRIAVSFVVPFRELSLPVGLHRVAFEVTGRIADKVQFVQATPLIPLRVTTGVRTQMSRPDPPPSVKEVPRKEFARILDDRGMREVEADFSAYELEFSFVDRQRVPVKIVGEFNHPLLLERAAPKVAVPEGDVEPPPSDTDPKESALPPPGSAWSSSDLFLPEHDRTIYFATNRNIAKPNDQTIARFGGTASALTYGSALVNIPLENHQRGELETPGYWSTPDPKRHFIIQSLSTLSRAAFQEKLSPKDVLVYVHGYNTSFEFAVLRGGQLQHDLMFPGRTVVFSWPSAGTLSGYSADEEQSANSAAPLAQVLEEIHQVVTRSPDRRIHAIAHSMGNRVLLAAIREWELNYAKEPADKLLGQVILAAPDVDAATFAALLPSVIRRARSATLYYCPNDAALLASQAIHVNKPVGLAPFFTDGLDTINAEQVDTTMIGHGYYAAARELLFDLRLMLSYSKRPDDRRPPLGEKKMVYGYPLWAFVPIAR